MYSEVAHAIVYTPPADPRFMDVVMRLQEIHERATRSVWRRRDDPKDDLLERHRRRPGPPTANIWRSTGSRSSAVDHRRRKRHHHEPRCLRLSSGCPSTRSSASGCGKILGASRALARNSLGLQLTEASARTVRKPVRDRRRRAAAGLPGAARFRLGQPGSRAIDDPDEIVLDRLPNRHQAFGPGCTGARTFIFTRMEFRVVLEQVLDRLPGFVVDRSGSERYEASVS